ncbi:TIGR03619 family F420-dependent LLM class oxidoreductase [Amycolatopsis sp. NBC_01286]|uniref:TIGR03619 family F420-dependent LLM class oxidoreductase n=1 Tax=Amycolatopsis sp. NBC_01286 TaxID=2903560 RepID=UPI002E12264A|nr:TIGR03619 family F420-dependent LLM class oxidoreductase [Amycolatopsis sp. NBC_01286]
MIDDSHDFVSVCRGVEDSGFDSLWLSEVIASPALDPLAGLAFAAGVTERIKLGTSVLVAPGRSPAVLAKAIATLDLLSGGRFLPILGLGTVHPDEQQSFNVTREDRGPWLDEAVHVMRRLWSEESVAHSGTRFRLDGVGLPLRPRRCPPVWLGGRVRSELRRVGRLADGWLASFATPAEVARGIAEVRTAASEAGREIEEDHYGVLLLYTLREPSQRTAEFLSWRRPDLSPAQGLPTGSAMIAERIREYVDAGASKFVLVPADRPDSWTAELGELAQAVLPLQNGVAVPA